MAVAKNKQRDNNKPPKSRGRPKGSPNKTTALLKDAILQAAELAGNGKQKGIVNYLKKQALEQPGPFMGLLGKVLPMQMTGIDDENGNPTAIVITVVHPK